MGFLYGSFLMVQLVIDRLDRLPKESLEASRRVGSEDWLTFFFKLFHFCHDLVPMSFLFAQVQAKERFYTPWNEHIVPENWNYWWSEDHFPCVVAAFPRVSVSGGLVVFEGKKRPKTDLANLPFPSEASQANSGTTGCKPKQHDVWIVERPLASRVLHPGRSTWNLRIHPWKRKIISQTIIFRFYVNLRVFCAICYGKSTYYWDRRR